MPQISPSTVVSSAKYSFIYKQSNFVGLVCVLSLISIWLGRIYGIPNHMPLSSFNLWIIALIGLVLLSKKPKIARFLLLVLLPAISFINASNFKLSLTGYKDLYGQSLGLIGVVQDDAAYNQYGDYEFNLTKLYFAQDGEFLQGRIRVRTKQNVAVYRGDRIYVEGKLKDALGSRTGSISYAKIEVLESSPTVLEKARLKFFSSIYSSLPEPHASLGIGFLAGVRSSITKEFQNQLSLAGLTHIIAVSGYNLTILVLAISRLGKRLSKYQRLVISLSLILIFLLITGFAPSIVRASVVCLISLACTFFGRKINPLNLILISAFLTSVFNPAYLWEDIGWWLSFLAFFGVLILAPAISSKIYRKEEPGLLGSVIIESLSAQILTAPLIAHVFGTFSAISLVANLLVIPLVPFVMALVFIVGMSAMLNPNLGMLLALFPKIVLTCIILVIEGLARVPWASSNLKLSQATMLVIYLLILGVLILNYQKNPISKIKKD